MHISRSIRVGRLWGGMVFLLLIAVLLLVVVHAETARAQGSRTIVGPDESIQAAVRAASTGDTIVVRGVHREDVVIRKDGITLLGSNAVLRPPENPDSPCGPSGICLLGKVDFATGEVSDRVSDVSVINLTVRGFDDTGIIAFGARNARFVNNRAINNHGYGIAAFVSTGTRITSNVTRGSEDAGIYVGDSPDANAKISGNETYDNFLGILIRNALRGSVYANEVHDNCLGVLFLADAPGPAGAFGVRANKVHENTRSCEATDEAPPISGVGIALLGARSVEIIGNSIQGNRPTGPTLFRGGVVLVRGFGGTPPSNNEVTGNTILRNAPDIFWDGSGSGNDFRNNRCGTSVPARLCS